MGGWMSHSHLAGPTLRFRGDPELHWGLGRVQSAGPGDPDSLGGAWAVPPGGPPSSSNKVVVGIRQPRRCLCEMESQEGHSESISA